MEPARSGFRTFHPRRKKNRHKKGGHKREASAMEEAEARAALRAFVGVGHVEPWIAGRPWQAAPGGWGPVGSAVDLPSS